MSISCRCGSGSFAKETRPCRWKAPVGPPGVYKKRSAAAFEAGPLTTAREVAESSASAFLRSLGICPKLESWEGSGIRASRADRTSEILSLPSAFSYSTRRQTLSPPGCEALWRVDSMQQSAWPAQRLDGEAAPKRFPNGSLPQKEDRALCSVVCCRSDPLQLLKHFFLCLLFYCIFVKLQPFESQWNHYIWAVCSANW